MPLTISNLQLRVHRNEDGTPRSHVVIALAEDETNVTVLLGVGDSEDAAFTDLWARLRQQFEVSTIYFDADHVEIEGAPVQIDKMEGHVKL